MSDNRDLPTASVVPNYTCMTQTVQALLAHGSLRTEFLSCGTEHRQDRAESDQKSRPRRVYVSDVRVAAEWFSPFMSTLTLARRIVFARSTSRARLANMSLSSVNLESGTGKGPVEATIRTKASRIVPVYRHLMILRVKSMLAYGGIPARGPEYLQRLLATSAPCGHEDYRGRKWRDA